MTTEITISHHINRTPNTSHNHTTVIQVIITNIHMPHQHMAKVHLKDSHETGNEHHPGIATITAHIRAITKTTIQTVGHMHMHLKYM